MIEAHLKRSKPIAVSDYADTLDQALDGAIVKLIGMIESILGRQRDQRNNKAKQSEFELKISAEK